VQTTKTQFGVGASLLRREDDRHLRGRGEFVSDIRLPGTQEVVFVRSPHAHARIRGVRVPPEMRGRVFTAADLPGMQPIRIVTQASGAKSPAWPPLATDKARYVGEAIAACVAPTRAEAEDIANAVEVDFEVLDAVVDAPTALRGGGPLGPAAAHGRLDQLRERPAEDAHVVVLARDLGGGEGLAVLAEAVVQQGGGVLAGHSPPLTTARHAVHGGLDELGGLGLMAPPRGDAQGTVRPELAPGRVGDRLCLRDERRALLQLARVCVQQDAGPDR